MAVPPTSEGLLMRRTRSLVLTLCLMLGVAAVESAAQTRPLPSDSLVRARRASTLLIAGHADSVIDLIPNASEQMKQQIHSAAETFTTRAGSERSLIEERWIWRQGRRQYWRILETTGAVPEPVVIRWVFLDSGAIAGIGVGLLSSVPPIDSVVSRRP